MKNAQPLLHSAACVRRSSANPVLTADDLAYDSNLVFNAGVVRFGGGYRMLFRNDYGYRNGQFAGTNLGVAESTDGIRWTPRRAPMLRAEDVADGEVRRIYDPRLTEIDGTVYICFAMDTAHGIRGGIGRIRGDFEGIDILSLSVPDNRNMVLFPAKIGGMYVRLERPFPVYSRGRDRFDIWLSRSPDLKFWGESELVLGVEDVPFANDKIGPAAPPIRTEKGWLTLFHTVDRDNARGKNGWEPTWQKRYCAGVMLLDLDRPEQVIGLSRTPLIAPEAPYETDGGFRNDVIFPGGLIAEPDGRVKIYYGAADTVECLAESTIAELLALCAPV